MKIKLLSFFVVVFICFSSLGKGFVFNPEEIIPSDLIESQPIFQYSSLLCMIPVNIVNNLLDPKQVHRTIPAKTPSKQAKKNRSNTSSDYSLSASNGQNARSGLKADNSAVPKYALRSFGYLQAEVKSAHHPPGPPVALIMLMMLLFVILPRSGNSESAVFFCRRS